MDCLIIRKVHLDKILAGTKTWEIRGSRTHKRGRIGLIESGSGTIVGECDLIACTDKLNLNEYLRNQDKHLSNKDKLPYNTTFGWILTKPKRYNKPKIYCHPKGAIIWVKT